MFVFYELCKITACKQRDDTFEAWNDFIIEMLNRIFCQYKGATVLFDPYNSSGNRNVAGVVNTNGWDCERERERATDGLADDD